MKLKPFVIAAVVGGLVYSISRYSDSEGQYLAGQIKTDSAKLKTDKYEKGPNADKRGTLAWGGINVTQSTTAFNLEEEEKLIEKLLTSGRSWPAPTL